MMAMTTSSSISVKPELRLERWADFIMISRQLTGFFTNLIQNSALGKSAIAKCFAKIAPAMGRIQPPVVKFGHSIDSFG
jgi:hypothetical protein